MGVVISKSGPANISSSIGEIDGRRKLVDFFTNLFIRNLVSKNRRRLLVGGYDLDMSYITNHLLAMSFPSENVRAIYRNPLWQVKAVLDTRHHGCYKVYNLCIEQSYDTSNFHGRVEVYPFEDKYVAPLSMIKRFCQSVHSWLSRDPRNIAVVHCMAGKGRTGLMVCAYLVYCGMPVDEALDLYSERRTTNNQGISIASQRRYVFYWSKVLSFPKDPLCAPPQVNLPRSNCRELRRIRLYDMTTTKSVFFAVFELQKVLGQHYQPTMEIERGWCKPIKQGYNHAANSPKYYISFSGDGEEEEDGEKENSRSHYVMQMDTESSVIYEKTCLDYSFQKPSKLYGDIRVVFSEKIIGRLFYTCFNTAFIESSLLQLKLGDLDKVGLKGRSLCGSDFCLELVFEPVNAI